LSGGENNTYEAEITDYHSGRTNTHKLPNIHPGEILEEEFLKPYHITAYRLAKEAHIPLTRIADILKHRRKITPDTALRFSKFFGNTPDFWLGIQMEFDLREKKTAIQADLETIHSIKELVA
jgi:addiction module HigA family antidote